MGKLRALSGREVCAVLERHEFQLVRQRGSHLVMQRRTDEGTITVPVPDHAELRVGTLRSIIRQSGVNAVERSHLTQCPRCLCGEKSEWNHRGTKDTERGRFRETLAEGVELADNRGRDYVEFKSREQAERGRCVGI